MPLTFPRRGLPGCLLVLALLWPVGCGNRVPAPAEPAGPPVVRVLIRDGTDGVKLTAASPPVVRTGSVGATGEPRRLNVPPGVTVTVSLTPAGWQVGAVNLGAGVLTIEPEPEGSVAIDGKAYRGHYRLVPLSAGRFQVVNHVHIDAYLKGVLAKEMFPEFAVEAYRAQAIVARTYALYEWRTNPTGKSYDLFDDTRSQVYGGISAESAKARAAVDDTAGVVVAHGPAGQEKIFKAYFSACCGGAGQSATDAFGEPHVEALTDQWVGNRCAEAPRFRWATVTVNKEELTRRLRKFGQARDRVEKDMSTVQRVDVAKLNRSGRPTHFTVTDARGARYLLAGEELRWAVNTEAPSNSTLYSSYVHPVTESTSVRFENGHGHGHGVGLCQWCAEAQGKKGVRHEEIVVSAFKGSKLIRAY